MQYQGGPIPRRRHEAGALFDTDQPTKRTGRDEIRAVARRAIVTCFLSCFFSRHSLRAYGQLESRSAVENSRNQSKAREDAVECLSTAPLRSRNVVRVKILWFTTTCLGHQNVGLVGDPSRLVCDCVQGVLTDADVGREFLIGALLRLPPASVHQRLWTGTATLCVPITSKRIGRGVLDHWGWQTAVVRPQDCV